MSAAPGTAEAPALKLCRLDEIEDGQARGFTVPRPESGALAGPPGDLEILVFRRGPAVHGYVNACPHIGSPLDWIPHRFMSDDGKHLHCSTHGALFRPEDGHCVSGPCEGDRLTAVSVQVRDGEVRYRPG